MALSLLALLPFFAEAQNTEQLDARIDSLAEETATLDKIVKGLSKFKVSAYIQGQYQYGQEDATLKVGDKNEHEDKGFNRIGIRRGRLKFEYNDGIGTGAVQIEANDKGVSFRDLYIGIKDPWTKRSQLMAGVFNRPFGHEIGYSTSGLESPERATIIQYFFPDERDLTTTAYEMDGKRFIEVDKGRTGTYMKREYIGLDAQFSFLSSWGTTTLRAEGLLGTQPGIASSSKSPNSGTRPEDLPENSLFKRPFIGYFFYLVQDIGTSPFSAVFKYDVYDPNTRSVPKTHLPLKPTWPKAHSVSVVCTASTNTSVCRPITNSTSTKRVTS